MGGDVGDTRRADNVAAPNTTRPPTSSRDGSDGPARPAAEPERLGSGRAGHVAPSLLAADLGNLAAAVRAAVAAGATWLHVDVFDGSAVGARGALSSLGPASIRAIRAAAPAGTLVIEAHLGVADAGAQLDAVAAAGADRVTFQWEALLAAEDDHGDRRGDDAAADDVTERRLAAARALAGRAAALGLASGICVAPATDAAEIAPLVEEGAIDYVDVLGVEPGYGGQPLQREMAFAKLRALRARHGDARLPLLALDGGVDSASAADAAAAGANVLIAGTAVFGRGVGGVGGAVAALRRALRDHSA